jgi:hypothetical protein
LPRYLLMVFALAGDSTITTFIRMGPQEAALSGLAAGKAQGARKGPRKMV